MESRPARLVAFSAAFFVVLGCTGTSAPATTASAPATAATGGASSAAATASPSPTLVPTLPPPSQTILPSQAIPKITPLPSAPDSGVKIHLVAKSDGSAFRWSVTELTVPAGQVWHLVMDNEDEDGPHNFAIAHKPELLTTIFGPTFRGIATHTFDIPGLPAGTYQFVCSLHANTMMGVLTIK